MLKVITLLVSLHGDEILLRTACFILRYFYYNFSYIIGSGKSHFLANESSNSAFPSSFKMTAPTPGPEAFSN